MYRKISRALAVAILAIIALSCLDTIELGQGANLEDGIALSGRMWVEGSEASVSFRAGRLFRFTSNRSERLLSAEVTLELSNGSVYPLQYDLPKDLFEVRFDLPRSEQNGLEVRILVITNEGDDYLSDWDPLPEEFVPDTLIPIQSFDDAGRPVAISYELQTPARRSDGSGVAFLYRFSQSYRVLTASVPIVYNYYFDSLRQTQLTLIGPKADYAGNLRSIDIYTDDVDWQYAEGFYLNVTQDPLSDAAYDYFRKFLSILNRDQSIFEPSPGELPGNFSSLTNPDSERVFGFFYVTRPQVVRAGIPEGVVDVEAFCTPITNFDHPRCGASRCFRADCVPRPSYWTF